MSNNTLQIKVRNLGPIKELNGNLSSKNRNIILAANGLGKSKIAGALAHLNASEKSTFEIELLDNHIINFFAEGKKSELEIKKGTDVLGKIEFSGRKNESGQNLTNLKIQQSTTRFYVFSEDYITKQLRETNFKLNDKIDNKILLDEENIEISNIKEEINKTYLQINNKKIEINDDLEKEKNIYLIDEYKINRKLISYREITLEKVIGYDLEDLECRAKKAIADELNKIKELDITKIQKPNFSVQIADLKILLATSRDILLKEYKRCSLPDKLNDNINNHKDFYKTGLEIYDNNNDDECPFCQQKIDKEYENKTVEYYKKYFESTEYTAKKQIEENIKNTCKNSEEISSECNRYNEKINNISEYIKDISYLYEEKESLVNLNITDIQKEINFVLIDLNKKNGNVELEIHRDFKSLEEKIGKIYETIKNNENIIEKISKKVKTVDKKRLDLCNELCHSFLKDYVKRNKEKIIKIRELEQTREASDAKRIELEEKYNKGITARQKISENFNKLISLFFPGKYHFDRNDFSVSLKNDYKPENISNVFSDGEKTIVAFCYFLSSVYKDIKNIRELDDLYLILDDPINSVSSDYIYKVAEILKYLCIDQNGNLILVPAGNDRDKKRDNDHTDKKDNDQRGENYRQVPWLIFTHSSLFFNICVNGRVVDKNAAFVMSEKLETHEIKRVAKYFSNFEKQLRHIQDVTNTRKPEHYTANAIRSVLETVSSFCYPDATLTDFLNLYSKKYGVLSKVIIINDLSHGRFEEGYTPDNDLVECCKYAIEIVKEYAPGRVKNIEKLGPEE